jgi:glycosyltransferase involved in cell wall biosynthesis
MTVRKTRIAYLVTHPIQYQAPLLRRIAASPDIDLTVYFQSDISVRSFFDADFGRPIEWDVPLLDGYRSEFLPALGRRDRVSALRPFSYGILRRLFAEKYDFLWVHGYSRWFNWVAMAAARLSSTRVLLRDDATPISRPRSKLKQTLKREILFRWLRAVCDGFLATGTRNREFYLQNGIRPERLFSVPNCVDNDYFAARAQAAAADREALRASLGLEPGRPVILFAGKFRGLKRAGDLIAAVRRLNENGSSPSPYLILAGDGALRQELENAAHPIADSVRFTGFRNQSELPAFFDLCDVFVLSSEFETWGLAVNEAMSAGRAVIVSDRVGCAPDLVQNGINGFCYPCGDVDALTDCLAKVLHSPETIRAMGEASAAIIAQWGLQQDVDGLRAAFSALGGRE